MRIVLIVMAVVLAIILGGLAYMGAFSPVAIEERSAGPYEFIYVQEPGTDSGRIGALTEALGARLEQAGVTNRQPMQIYYPLGRGIQNQIGFLVDRAVTMEVLGSDTFYRVIPVQSYMTARFPFRNPLSFLVGHFRIDPALKAHRKEKGYGETSVVVILQGDHILYLQSIARA